MLGQAVPGMYLRQFDISKEVASNGVKDLDTNERSRHNFLKAHRMFAEDVFSVLRSFEVFEGDFCESTLLFQDPSFDEMKTLIKKLFGSTSVFLKRYGRQDTGTDCASNSIYSNDSQKVAQSNVNISAGVLLLNYSLNYLNYTLAFA